MVYWYAGACANKVCRGQTRPMAEARMREVEVVMFFLWPRQRVYVIVCELLAVPHSNRSTTATWHGKAWIAGDPQEP